MATRISQDRGTPRSEVFQAAAVIENSRERAADRGVYRWCSYDSHARPHCDDNRGRNVSQSCHVERPCILRIHRASGILTSRTIACLDFQVALCNATRNYQSDGNVSVTTTAPIRHHRRNLAGAEPRAGLIARPGPDPPPPHTHPTPPPGGRGGRARH